jgi:hypothetical protein
MCLCPVTRRRDITATHTTHSFRPSDSVSRAPITRLQNRQQTAAYVRTVKWEKFLTFACYIHGLRSILNYFFIIYAVPRETEISAVTKAPEEIHSTINHRSASQCFPSCDKISTLLATTNKYKTHFVNIWRKSQILKFCFYRRGLDNT